MTISVASKVSPGPMAIDLTFWRSKDDGNSAIAPLDVSGQAIATASGTLPMTKSRIDAGTAM